MKKIFFAILCALTPIWTCAQTAKTAVYRLDSVTIRGQILNRNHQMQPCVRQSHFITDELIETPIFVDSLGYFNVKVPAFNATRLFIYHVAPQGRGLYLFALPGEEVIVHADWKTDKFLFKGKNARQHQEVYDYSLYHAQANLKNEELSTDEKISHEHYLQKIKRWAFQEDSIWKIYIKKNPKITKRAQEEIRVGTYNTIATYLMQRRFELDRMKGEQFDAKYMKYADSMFVALPKPYTLVSTTFLRDYLDYYSEINQVSWRQVLIDYAIANKKIEPTEEQKKNPSLILNAVEYRPMLNDAFNELKETDSFAKYMLDYYNGGTLFVPMPAELKELTTSQAFYKFLYDYRVALSKANVDYFKQQVKNPTLRKFVLDYQNKLLALESTNEYAGSLKDATPFKDCKTGEELFSRLIAPHKGKIIYVDIWGTWCLPCKEEMKYVGTIKEALQGKEIVFLYLANGSPVKAWENIIKEYHLTGHQVEHYNLPSAQQNMVERYLGVRSFPTYMVIDKQGKIINKDPLRPSRGKLLIDYLNEQLSK